ncbi:MAG TPA: peptidase [Xanthomonadaceae bacterium]|nr:peptidase [Xanthomonadaceae bacterium]
MRPWLRWTRRVLIAGVAASLLGLLALTAVIWTVWPQLPDVRELRDVELALPMSVYSADGKLIALFGETRRFPVAIDDVPDRVKQAFLAAEDARFYDHRGLDAVGILRAVWLIVSTDRARVPGGSTITQQVARDFYLSNEYSYARKFREMLLAIKMERELSKDEIFELYLNKIFFGNRAYGVAAAAEFYFGKSLDELTIAEAATLAGIPKFPSSANPISNPERAMERRDYYVLPRMHELGFISDAELAGALAEPNNARPHEPTVEVDAPYVAEMVRQVMEERFGAEALTSGFRVSTTLRAADQNAAVAAVRDGLLAYDQRRGWRGAEGRIEDARALDEVARQRALRGHLPIPGLQAAVVLQVDATGATVQAAREGEMVLDAAAFRWTGRAPVQAVEVGDVVRVRRDAEGRPVLAQLPQAQAALVSLEAETGALRALVGGFSFAQNKFNRATQAQRQPGSSFKPFVYAAAFERGYSPSTIVIDAPVVFRDRAGNVWRPQNYEEDFAGPMRLREAMVQSRNLVSVRLLDAIGVQFAQRYITQLGFTPESLPPNLSMSLGTSSLTPMAVTRAYAAFANGGYRIDPWFIARVEDRHGTVVMETQPLRACPRCAGQPGSGDPSGVVDGFNFGTLTPPARAAMADAADASAAADAGAAADGPVAAADAIAPRAIDPRTAFLVRSLLLDVVKRGTGTAARALGRADIGGKTGSTNDHRDAWFAGLGGDLVTTVWVGRDDFSPLGRGEYGGRAALPIWIDYMRVALEGVPVAAPEPPPGLLTVTIDPATGGLLPSGEPGGMIDYVKTEDYDRMVAGGFSTDGIEVKEEAFDVF